MATAYSQDGYTVYRQHIPVDFINKLNMEIDLMQKQLPIGEDVFDENGTGLIKQIQYLHKKSKLCNELLTYLKPIATELITHEDYYVLNMQLFEKHPGISKHTRSHQDNAYFRLTPTTALTMWIALDDIDEQNGCLYYAPKTHILPTRKHSRYNKNTTFRVRSGVPGLSLCLHEHPEETDVVETAQSGDVFVHNCNTIHRAGKNDSINRRRRAIGIVFIPNECTIDPRLEKYHKERLSEDIKLQEIRNPTIFNNLKAHL